MTDRAIGTGPARSPAAIRTTALAVAVGDTRSTEPLSGEPWASIASVVTTVTSLKTLTVAEAATGRSATTVAGAARRVRTLTGWPARLPVGAHTAGASAAIRTTAHALAGRLADLTLPSRCAIFTLRAGPTGLRATVRSAHLAFAARLTQPAGDLTGQTQDGTTGLTHVGATIAVIEAAGVAIALTRRTGALPSAGSRVGARTEQTVEPIITGAAAPSTSIRATRFALADGRAEDASPCGTIVADLTLPALTAAAIWAAGLTLTRGDARRTRTLIVTHLTSVAGATRATTPIGAAELTVAARLARRAALRRGAIKGP